MIGFGIFPFKSLWIIIFRMQLEESCGYYFITNAEASDHALIYPFFSENDGEFILKNSNAVSPWLGKSLLNTFLYRKSLFIIPNPKSMLK